MDGNFSLTIIMFVYFAALLSVASAANLCCSPDKWQADVGLVMTTSTNGKSSYIQGSMKMSYDAVNKIVAYDQNITVDGNPVLQRIVLDNKNGVMYTIRDGTCNTTKSNDWFPFCVPDNATLIGDNMVFGLGNNAIQGKGYSAQIQGNIVNMAVTADNNCVPVAETVAGKLPSAFAGDGNMEYLEFLLFSNVTPGIAEMSVFFVPAQCESESVKVQVVGRRSLIFT